MQYRLESKRWIDAPSLPHARAESELEGFDGTRQWVCIERLLVTLDLDSGGKRTFYSQGDAHAFRQRLYDQVGVR